MSGVAQVNQPNKMGQTALHVAARTGSLQLIESLLGTHHDSDRSNRCPWGSQGSLWGVAPLERGAEVNHADLRHRTPVAEAVAAGRADVLRLLLRHGARVSVDDGSGASLVLLACKTGQLHCAADLVKWLMGDREDRYAPSRSDRREVCVAVPPAPLSLPGSYCSMCCLYGGCVRVRGKCGAVRRACGRRCISRWRPAI